MPTFSYQTKTGAMAKLEAPDSASALRALAGKTDANPRSGIMEDRPAPEKNILASKKFGGSTPETPVGSIGGSKVTVSQYGGTPQQQADQALAQLVAQAQANATQNINEEQTLQERIRMYQPEIDAVNQVYAQMIQEQTEQNRGTLGSARAIQARSGFLGSDFGRAEDAKVNKENKASLDLIRAEQSAKINSILGLARQSAAQEIERKRKAQQEGLQNYLTYLASAQERRQSRLSALASELVEQGLDPAEIDANDLKRIAKEYGFSQEDVVLGFKAEQKARAEAEAKAKQEAEDKAFDMRMKSRINLKAGEQVMEFNPETGEMEVIASRPNDPVAVDPSQYGTTGEIEFDKNGVYIGSNPTFVGRTKAEVNSTVASRSGIYSTLNGYTDAEGNKLGDKWLSGTLSKSDVRKLSDSDVKTIVTSKAQIDEPGRNINLSDAEVQKQVNGSGVGGWIEQEYGKIFEGTNYEEAEVKDILDTALVKSGGVEEEVIILSN